MPDVTTQVLDGRLNVEYPRLELCVVSGPDLGVRRQIDPDGIRIGTATNCQLSLSDRAGSRLHCEIRMERGVLKVIDLESTNGTFVDAVRVRDAELLVGSRLRVGASMLQVVAGQGAYHL